MKAYKIGAGPDGLSDLLHSEYDSTYTSNKRVLKGGSGVARVVAQFQLVATVNRGATTVTPAAAVSASGGTPGNGAIGTVTADAGVPSGEWNIVIIEPAANGGVFEVSRPGGEVDGVGVVGTAYNGGINFTLADGSTDFAAGDRIKVTVGYAADGETVAWDPTATDGSQYVTGIACYAAEAAVGVDDEIITLERGPAIVRRERIVYPAGATTDQKATAIVQLEALGIQCRQSG